MLSFFIILRNLKLHEKAPDLQEKIFCYFSGFGNVILPAISGIRNREMETIEVRISLNKNFILQHKGTLLYGLALAILMFLLKWLELRYIIFDHSFELYVGFIAIIFTALGIWLALKLSKPKIETVIVEKEVAVTNPENRVLNSGLISELQLSKRELEILDLMAKGLSNEEIASSLFVSLSTVKSHNQNLFSKLDVKRRTQAVEKARRLNLIL